MTTYKIGNQVDCVIRACNSTPIGEYKISYDHEPYTIIQGENGIISFSSNNTNFDSKERNGGYATENIDSFSLYNVILTDKILNLIYCKKEGFSITFHEKVTSGEDKKIFFSNGFGKIKKLVFVYYSDNDAAELENAYSTVDDDYIEVEHENACYNIVYEVITDSIYSLDKRNNIYVSLDISTVSNENDNTSRTWLHIDKALVKVNKTLYFNNNANAVDLTFLVINDNTTINYIGWED